MQCLVRLSIIGFLLLAYNPSYSLTVLESNNQYVSITSSQKNLNPGKPSRVKVVLYKLVQKLLVHKKSKSVIAIAFGILSALLLAFLLFVFAYGGAPGVITILVGVAGVALIVFGLIKISKAQKRKRERL
jgi:fatty acid desaturase